MEASLIPSVEATLSAAVAAGRVWRDPEAGVWRVWAFDAARSLLLDREFHFPAPAPLNGESLPPPVAAAARRGRDVQVRWFALDSELHRRVRPILAAALAGASVAKLEAGVRARADALLDAAASDPSALAAFTLTFPREIQLDLFGAPARARPGVIESAALAAALFPHRKSDPVRPWMAQAALAQVVEDAFDAPAPTGAVLIASMQAAVVAGRLQRADAIAALSVVMIAGLETAGRALTALVGKLAADAEIRVHAAAGAAALSGLIEEELRDSAGPQVVGCFDRDLELEGGARIAAGERILVDLRQANHDPARFADPDRFDMGRDDADHIAFGAGTHICVGRHFARLHLKVGVAAFLAAYPGLARSCPDGLALLAARATP